MYSIFISKSAHLAIIEIRFKNFCGTEFLTKFFYRFDNGFKEVYGI